MNIHIEYCEKWNYGPEFDRVSKIIKNYNSDCQIKGNQSPPRSGAFEITINNKLVYSKFDCGMTEMALVKTLEDYLRNMEQIRNTEEWFIILNLKNNCWRD